METLFTKAGLNWKEMEKNEAYDISDKNIRVKSYNHEKNEVELKKILSFIRKDDDYIYKLVTKNSKDVLLKCSGAHRIWDATSNSYFHVKDIGGGKALTNTGAEVEFTVEKTNEVMPIVDMEVEGNSNYFTNGILSHNTTSGGNALKFYDSIRLKFSKIGKNDEGSGDDKETVSVRVRVEAVKNKTAPPFKKGEFIITFLKGIDEEASTLEVAIAKGVIVKKGGWFSIDGSNVAQGMVKLKTYLEENPDVFSKIKEQIKGLRIDDFVPTDEERTESELDETADKGNELSGVTDKNNEENEDDDSGHSESGLV